MSETGIIIPPRKGFIRHEGCESRWIIVHPSRSMSVDGDPEGNVEYVFFNGIKNGEPVFSKKSGRIYKTKTGAERTLTRLKKVYGILPTFFPLEIREVAGLPRF